MTLQEWREKIAQKYGCASQQNASLSDSLSFAITQLKMVRHLALMKGDEKILALCNAALDSPLITKYDKEK